MEIWISLCYLILAFSTGIFLFITCNKSRQPAAKRQRRQKESDAESIISKKYEFKDGKKGDGNNNDDGKSQNKELSKQLQRSSVQSSSNTTGEKRESEVDTESQNTEQQQSKRGKSNKRLIQNETPA
uniref:Uncharacterized protein n=1 Tax=Panagrolaimus sp. ES5 TaxID=591445 RepID=A0AC34GMC1_9BILA